MLNIKALLLKLVQHYNTIGTIEPSDNYGYGSAISIPNSSTWQSVDTLAGTKWEAPTLSAGTWVVFASMRFASKANTSYRSARINAGGETYGLTHWQAGTGAAAIELSATFNKTSSWKLDFDVRQYSSSSTTALNLSDFYYRAMKLK